MSANDRQVGGDHYKKGGEEHWDRIWRLYGRGYFVGCATKYIERYHEKNGKQDLEKSKHYIDKLIELEYPDELVCSHCKTDHTEETGCPPVKTSPHPYKGKPDLIRCEICRCFIGDGYIHLPDCPKYAPLGYVNQDG